MDILKQGNEAPNLEKKGNGSFGQVVDNDLGSKDNTPVRYSDHIIDDAKIEIDISGSKKRRSRVEDDDYPQITEQPPLETNLDNLQTEVVVNIDTDRKLTDSQPGGGQNGANQFQQSKQAHFQESTNLGPRCFRMRRMFLWIGAIISFLNFTGDILYTYKAPFVGEWIIPALSLLCMRWFLCVVIAFCNMRGNEVVSSMKDPRNTRTKDLTMMMVFTDFFSDFGGMPLIMTFGFYRVLSPRDFSRTIICGYLLELCTSLVPMLVVILVNNELNELPNTRIMELCTTLRIIAVVCFWFELAVLCWEFSYVRRMRRRHERATVEGEFRLKTKEEKMKVHGPKIAMMSLVIIALTIFILPLGLYFMKGRECQGEGKVMYWGVCTNCQQEQCADCEFGPSKCRTCKKGYMMDGNKQCQTCNSHATMKEDEKCEKCQMSKKGDGTECLRCKEGFHLDHSSMLCVNCEEQTGIPNCAKCLGRTCLECQRGSFFKDFNGKDVCVKCQGQHEFCESCTDNKCVSCMEHIATMNDAGKCQKCTAPWQTLEAGWPHCYCPHIVNTAEGYQCQTCDELLPGCKKCEYVSSLSTMEYGKWVGWDRVLSGVGPSQLMNDQLDKPNEWVRCTEGDRHMAVDILVKGQQSLESQQQVKDQKTKLIANCNSVVPGCDRCDEEFNAEGDIVIKCAQCRSDHYIDHEYKRYSDSVGALIKGKCNSCTVHSDKCIECNPDKCTKCAPNHFTNKWVSTCFKCFNILCDWKKND